MAARKKARAKPKPKPKRQKMPARKPASRKKTAPAKKKVVRKKPMIRRVAPKKKPAARPAPAPKAPPVSPPRHPARPAAPAVVPVPLAEEERVGIVTHYYAHISVAVVQMEAGSLRLGDTIHVRGHTSDFRQGVQSMQIEHELVAEVRAGQEFGLKVTEHAREHDVVYKVTAPHP